VTTQYHTPLSETVRIPATGATLNPPLAQLDAGITTAVTAEAVARSAAVVAEAASRVAGDAALQADLDALIIGSGTSDAETIAARGGFATVDARLDNSDARLDSAEGSPAVQRLLAKLRRDADDAAVVVLGDSTSNGPGELIDLWAVDMAARWPAYTWMYSLFDPTSQTYPAPSTLAAGSGTHTITVWNASVPGADSGYHLIPSGTLYGDIQPDLVLINTGHNDWRLTPSVTAIRMHVLAQTVQIACPEASIVLVSQNPNIEPRVSELVAAGQQTTDQRAAVTQQVAQRGGYGFVDVNRAYHEDGRAMNVLVSPDGIHPYAAGSRVAADALLAAFREHRDNESGALPVPTLLQPAPTNLLANGDFASFTAPPVLPDWIALYATVSKDTTHFERQQQGYGVRIQAADETHWSAIAQVLPSDLVTQLVGKWITLAVRMRVAAASASQLAGAVLITNGGSGPDDLARSYGCGLRYDEWYWNTVRYKAPAGTTTITCEILADSGGLNPNADITVDRAILTVGDMPHDMAFSTAQPAGKLLVGIPFSLVGTVTGTGDTALNAADSAAGTLDFGRMPWAGSIVGISLSSSSPCTAGTLTAKARDIGAGTTYSSPAAVLATTTGNTVVAQGRALAGVSTFGADTRLGMTVTGAGWTPTTDNLTGMLYVLFDAVGI
jgi:hypothetical protein